MLPDIDSGGTVVPSTIMRLSANPSLNADVHLNPPGGHLSGTDRATAYGGWVYFRDLFVRTRGKGYKMNFEAYFGDLMDADDLVASSTGASPSSGTSSSSTAAKERGLALKSSTLFEVSRLWICSPACARSRLQKKILPIFRRWFNLFRFHESCSLEVTPSFFSCPTHVNSLQQYLCLF